MFQSLPPQMVPLQIPNYMVQAVLVTLFCCLPIGIVAIFKANTINKKLAACDIPGALAESKANKKLLWIGVGVGLVIDVIWCIIAVASQNS